MIFLNALGKNPFDLGTGKYGILLLSGYGYGTVPGGRWAIDTEGGHVVVSVSLIRNGYEYGRRSRGRLFIPHHAHGSGYLFMITSLNIIIIGINIGDLFVFLAFDWNGW